MPDIFLSPSAQEFNPYTGGGSEEYYMNLLADALVPYLEASGISYSRNSPDEPFTGAIRRSNADSYKLHLALHSNASPPQSAGKIRGSQIYYYPGSSRGQNAADIFAANIKKIYPLPDRVQTVPTSTLGEVVRTKAPAILIEIAYHDNPEDARWIRNNLDEIAENLARSIAAFLNVPLILPQNGSLGTVATQGGQLNLRAEPSVNATIRDSIPNGTVLPILAQQNGWLLTEYNGIRGYVAADYVRQ